LYTVQINYTILYNILLYFVEHFPTNLGDRGALSHLNSMAEGTFFIEFMKIEKRLENFQRMPLLLRALGL